ncbi:MlaD family protein [Chitinophaga sp. HK235]|uniref:MlaD family protein n=1 Tax=Chitinophaga sp. HK235 TaxID=2952571 RepID=UPI001BAC4C33|nr:MlaD family protein [Chitinophaga sp. HK235]
MNRHLLIVGIFSFIALAFIAVAIWTLGRQHKVFGSKLPIRAIMADVGGLKEGDNIWFSGVKIGIVRTISLTEDGNVLVVMNIEQESRKYIHQDSKVKLGTDGLIGNRIIIVYGGTAGSPLIADTGYLHGNPLGTDMISLLDSSSGNLLQITRNLKEISHRILTGKGAITTLINDSTMAGNLQNSLSDARSAITNIRNASSSTPKMMNNLSDFSHRLNKEGSSINNLLADTISYARINKSIVRLQETMDTLAAFSANLKKASDELNNGNKNVPNVLLHDEAAGAQLKSMISNLDTASTKLKEDMEALQHNFLLRGFFKKKQKTTQQ